MHIGGDGMRDWCVGYDGTGKGNVLYRAQALPKLRPVWAEQRRRIKIANAKRKPRFRFKGRDYWRCVSFDPAWPW